LISHYITKSNSALNLFNSYERFASHYDINSSRLCYTKLSESAQTILAAHSTLSVKSNTSNSANSATNNNHNNNNNNNNNSNNNSNNNNNINNELTTIGFLNKLQTTYHSSIRTNLDDYPIHHQQMQRAKLEQFSNPNASISSGVLTNGSIVYETKLKIIDILQVCLNVDSILMNYV
jgi:hypothetical protein